MCHNTSQPSSLPPVANFPAHRAVRTCCQEPKEGMQRDFLLRQLPDKGGPDGSKAADAS